MLHELDKELESRGHKFVRDADDCIIFSKSKRSAQRVKHTITTSIEEELFLQVNDEKTSVGHVVGMKFLGCSFYMKNGECRFCVHSQSYLKLKTCLKELTGWSNGLSYDKCKEKSSLMSNMEIFLFLVATCPSWDCIPCHILQIRPIYH